MEREADEVDICIVGGGPAGLSAAIKLKQLANEAGNEDFRVVLLEKAGEVGDHIVSGNVLEPSALDELIPDWRSEDNPNRFENITPATKDKMRFLTTSGSWVSVSWSNLPVALLVHAMALSNNRAWHLVQDVPFTA
jgi:electron-transferring-flavoprotein dehydrogenase